MVKLDAVPRTGDHEGGEHLRQQIGADASHRGQPQQLLLLLLGDGLGLPPQGVVLLRQRDKGPARLRQLRHPDALAPLQKGVAQLRFQGLETAAESRLGYKEPSGRRRDAAGLRHGQKRLDLQLCHNCCPPILA